MEARQTTLTDLEERLADTGGSALRGRLVAELVESEVRLVSRLAGMVPRAEYATLFASIEAVRAAQAVLQTWVPETGPIAVPKQ